MNPFPPDCAARFRAEGQIASGGFGTIWRAVQIGLERPAAVKLLAQRELGNPQSVERFQRELRAIRGLSCNCKPCYQAGQARYLPYGF